MRAESRVGVGSTFTASIPLSPVPPDATALLATPLDAVPPSPIPAGPVRTAPTDRPAAGSAPHAMTGARQMCLLYIEDVSSNVGLMEQVVGRRPNWQMTVAGLGGLGHDLATTNRPDLVLLDLHLPDRPGIEVLKGLRDDPRTRDMRIVIVSADANPHQINRLLAAGADGYLTKPLAVADVLELLDSCERNAGLSRRSPGVSAGPAAAT